MGLTFYPSHSGKTKLNYDLKVNSSVALNVTNICRGDGGALIAVAVF